MMFQKLPALSRLGQRVFHATSKVFDKPKAFSPCEKTFIMVKPDGVQRGKVGKIISRFEERGFKLVGVKMMHPGEDLVKKHYRELVDKKFFPDLMAYIRSGPVVPMVWEGKNIVEISRAMIGQTNPMKSNPGTIRGDYSLELDRNLIHGSSDTKSAEEEVCTWFKTEEIMRFTMNHDPWVYSDSTN